MLQTIWLEVADSYIIDFEALPLQMLFHAIMILILFFVIGKLVFKPVQKILQKRTETVQNNLESAEQLKSEAEQLKADYAAKLDGAKKEREEILAKGRQDALQKEAAIVEEARQEAERIRARAERDILQEREKLQDEVRQNAVELAGAMAEKLMQHAVAVEDEEKLLDEAVKEMEEAKWHP